MLLYYKIDIINLKPDANVSDFEKYQYKSIGYLVLYYKKKNAVRWSLHGFITNEKLRELLGIAQYRKFTQDKREFEIIINKKA